VYKVADKKMIYLYCPLYNDNWTRADAGQDKFWGVSGPSMQAYLVLMGKAEEGRGPATPNSPLSRLFLMQFGWSWTFRARPCGVWVNFVLK